MAGRGEFDGDGLRTSGRADLRAGKVRAAVEVSQCKLLDVIQGLLLARRIGRGEFRRFRVEAESEDECKTTHIVIVAWKWQADRLPHPKTHT